MAHEFKAREAEARLCETFFKAHSVFTAHEFRSYLTAQDQQRAHRHDRLLQEYASTGRLHRLKRGLYAPRPPSLPADEEPVVALPQIAARMTPDAVLAYHTALECYGLAYSLWFHAIYAARKPAKKLRVAAGLIRGSAFPRALRSAGMEYAETTRTPRHGLRVTTLERTLVDIVDRPELCGGWDEVMHGYDLAPFTLSVLKPGRKINVPRMVKYAQSLGNAFTCAKVGFVLDLYQPEWGFDTSALAPLLSSRPRQRRYWELCIPRLPATWVPKWNLVVPCWLQQRAWRKY